MAYYLNGGMATEQKEQLQSVYDKIINYTGLSLLENDIIQGTNATTISNLTVGQTYLLTVALPMNVNKDTYILNDKLTGATIIKNSDETIAGGNPYVHLKTFLIRATETTITFPSNYAGAYMIIEVP